MQISLACLRIRGRTYLFTFLLLLAACGGTAPAPISLQPTATSNPRETPIASSTGVVTGATPVDTGADGGDAIGGYRGAAAKLLSTKSYHFVYSEETRNDGATATAMITSEGDATFAAGSLQMLHHTLSRQVKSADPNAGAAAPIEVIVVNDPAPKRSRYRKDKEDWRPTSEIDPVEQLLDQPNTLNPVDKDGAPQEVGTDEIDGERCIHYQYRAADATYDAWVHMTGGNFCRIQILAPDGNHSRTITFSRWDEPVAIERPE